LPVPVRQVPVERSLKKEKNSMSRFSWIVTAVVASLFSVGTTPSSAQTPAGVQKGPSLGGVTEYVFPNGLKVLHFPDPASPRITVNMTYLVGARHEGYGEGGMAHLLEHLLFIESTNGRKIKDELVSRGAAWNGSTSPDRTNYYETFPASEENLRWALGLEAERMVNMKMSKALLDVEMTVVRNEFERSDTNPQGVLQQRVSATAFSWHNYGKPTIGTREDIERVPIDRLAAFYKKFYRPDNAVLVIAGRVDEATALRLVSETIGKIPRPQTKVDEPYTVEPVQDGARFVELKRPGEQKLVAVVFHGPASGHPDSAALAVLAGVMNGPRGGTTVAQGRLAKALIDTKKATNVSMGSQAVHDPGLISVTAQLSSTQSQDEARDAILAALQEIVANPPSAEEVEQIRAPMLLTLPNSMGDSQEFGVNLSNAIAQGDWRLLFLRHNRIKDVGPADVVRVAKQYLKESNRTVGYFTPDANPERTIVPPTPEMETILKGLATDVKISRGEAFDPSPANIESRIQRGTLSNGMKVAVLNKQTVNDKVQARIDLEFGDASSLAGRQAAALVARALAMQGTKNRTYRQLQAEMSRLNAQIDFSGDAKSVSVTLQAPANNFEAAFRLVVEILREPAFPEDDFNKLKTRLIGELEVEVTDPDTLAQEAIGRHLTSFPAGHPLYPQRREERLEAMRKLTLDDVKGFQQQFYGTSHGQLAVVGPLVRTEFQPVAEQLLGSWNSAAPYQHLSATYRKVEPINQKIETPDKANSRIDAAMLIAMLPTDPDYPAMVLANYVLGGTITGRVPDRIRNREGLSYSVRTTITTPQAGNALRFGFFAIANPGNMPKAEASYLDELRKTMKDGFNETEVTAGKKAYLDSQSIGRSNDATLLTQIANLEYRGATFSFYETMESKIRAFTAAELTAVLKKYADPAALSFVKAGDFKAANAYR
jgi:zinc protease